MTAAQVRHLLLGITSYEDSTLGLPAGTTHNVRTLYDVLTDPAAGGVPRELCQVLEPGDHPDLLGEVARVAEQQPALVVYWTGQAAFAPDGGLCLAVPGSRAHDLATWMPASALAAAMTATATRRSDRLLILDACLSSAQAADPYGLEAEAEGALDSIADRGTAVWAGMGRTPTGFAANSQDPSVFTHELSFLFRETLSFASPLGLEAAHDRLGRAMSRSGYPPPCLRNAQAFRGPLTTASPRRLTPKRAAKALVRRTIERLASADIRRHALAVGVPVRGMEQEAAESPSPDARRFYQRLLSSGWGFTAETTRLLGTATREDLRSSIAALAKHGRNLILVYVSGAGEVFHDGSGLDLRVALSHEESISVSELIKELRRSQAERVTVLIDAYEAGVSAIAAHLSAEAAAASDWSKHAGASRLAITWGLTHHGQPGPDPLELTVQEQQSDPSTGDWGALLSTRDEADSATLLPYWCFSFPEADIRFLDSNGPLAPWRALLSRHKPAHRDPSVAQWLLSADSAPTAALLPPDPVPLAEPSKGTPQATLRRSQRARLRVVDGSLPTRPGGPVRLTFDYRPQDRDCPPQASANSPVQLTVLVSATDATVEPTLIHTHLTDQHGTPTHDIHVTPHSNTSVTLRVSVLRRADGALIQEITTVLPADVPEGAAL